MANIAQLKKLREETCVSYSECKKALDQSSGDIEKAKEFLRISGQKLAVKRSGKTTGEGLIESYIHTNKKIGVLLDIRCESDFVARSEEFKKLAREICLQIAAASPLFLKSEEIPTEFLDGEKKIYSRQFADSGKPQKIISQIIEGKVAKYASEVSLLSQVWIKDETKTIKDLINEHISRIGENIEIKKFARYEIC